MIIRSFSTDYLLTSLSILALSAMPIGAVPAVGTSPGAKVDLYNTHMHYVKVVGTKSLWWYLRVSKIQVNLVLSIFKPGVRLVS